MKTLTTYYDSLDEGYFYHIYNRAVGNEKLFHSHDNYRYFLKKYEEYLSAHLQTYCYCILPNHFHFLVQISDCIKDSDKTVSEQFRRLFITYSQAINKQIGRKGGLFMRPFKRKRITDEKYLKNVVQYIHNNPVSHHLCSNPGEYRYSSYRDILSFTEKGQGARMTSLQAMSSLTSAEVIDWFGDKENFIYCHKDFNELIQLRDVLH